MSAKRKLLLGIIVVIVAAAWFFLRSPGERVAIDLVQTFPTAERRPNPDVFSVIDATLAGQTKRAIFSRQDQVGTRIVWNVMVPNNAWLKVSLGLREEAWTMKGDGVLFRIGVSEANAYDALLSVVINPFANASDRQWDDVSFDLSPYAGRLVHLIFDTNSSIDGHDDRNGDLALWGEPRIVVR